MMGAEFRRSQLAKLRTTPAPFLDRRSQQKRSFWWCAMPTRGAPATFYKTAGAACRYAKERPKLAQGHPELVINPDPTILSYFAGGAVRDGIDTGLDTPFHFPVFSTLREVVIDNVSIRRLADALRMDCLYPHPDRLVPFEGNHDVVRFLTAAKGDRRKLRGRLWNPVYHTWHAATLLRR
jgi:hypothetical protein